MLRIVYPCNVVNCRHLLLEMDGMKLGEWIRNSKERGKLTTLGKELWIWEVKSTYLDQVNQACGEAGHLLAWRPVLPKKSKQQLH